jgi:hypothetical protein
MTLRAIVAMSFLAPFAACAEDPIPVGPEVISRIESRDIPVMPRMKLDVLVVVDTAPTMEGEQGALAANARTIMQTLEAMEQGAPDTHIAVVSSDLGTLGHDVGDARCSGDGDGGRMSTHQCGVVGDYIVRGRDRHGTPRPNYLGSLEETFACIATSLGADGCPWRQPLEAMRAALAQGRTNGFLRDDAALVVVFVGDGDDCSAADPMLYAGPDGSPTGPFACFAHGVVCDGVDDPETPGPRTGCRARETPVLHDLDSYVTELKSLKAHERDVAIGLITADGEVSVEPGPALAPSCQAGSVAGTPAIRLRAFAAQFDDRHVVTSLCDPDWTETLSQAEGMQRYLLSLPCVLGTPVDLGPTLRGLQPDISAAFIQVEDQNIVDERVLPACGSEEPCYALEPSPWCGDPGLRITWRPYLSYAPTYLRMQILVE